ncbi:unnamed protein product [Oppiella nova]|uniref:Uncharacterized protein n=1 Tax=Oppiella nova TaxID=334625 RepID=A0A7R9MCZ7_9ACAR|nr:unnamed protein product [Oppiella nova]CAG2174706.1 unnamed protein product [Oppiella nova]
MVFMTSICVEHLEKTRGTVINISSIRSTRPSPQESAYCMARSGFDMFTKCMATELGLKGIRVNSVNAWSRSGPLSTASPDLILMEVEERTALTLDYSPTYLCAWSRSGPLSTASPDLILMEVEERTALTLDYSPTYLWCSTQMLVIKWYRSSKQTYCENINRYLLPSNYPNTSPICPVN